MARSQFEKERRFPARLARVQRRSVENRLQGIALIRIEIELFRLDGAVLRSLGEHASREFVLCGGVAEDLGVRRLATAFGVEHAASLTSWLRLNQRPLAERPWITVVFGAPEEEDYRQPFQEIHPFDMQNYAVSAGRGEAPGELTLGKAATLLDISENTLRRRIEALEPRLAELLVRHTPGGHRRIDAKLLQILQSSGHLDRS